MANARWKLSRPANTNLRDDLRVRFVGRAVQMARARKGEQRLRWMRTLLQRVLPAKPLDETSDLSDPFLAIRCNSRAFNGFEDDTLARAACTGALRRALLPRLHLVCSIPTAHSCAVRDFTPGSIP